jgi:uncharacterized alkaline shock family protein YloU
MTLTVVDEGGTVIVTDAALQQIVLQAAEAVEGARVRRRNAEIAVDRSGARVMLSLGVSYGRVLPDVARAVQEQVSSALGSMCGVTVTAVDVTVEELD